MNPARERLAVRGLRAKKSWGQNFLVDDTVVQRIAHAASLSRQDLVVEIGAGLGALTRALAAVAGRVVAVERDADLVAVLREDLAGETNVEVRAADALAFDIGAAARDHGGPVIVAGNLPYQITSPLLFHILDAGAAVARAVLMVQREVAARMSAPPGNKTYGRLSVMLQQSAAVEALFHVPPGAFHPRPAVTSTVVRLTPRPAPLAFVADPALFAQVVREAFSTRRKMLRRSLEPAFGDAVLGAALASAGIDGRRRPETLAIVELARLAEGIARARRTAAVHA